MFCSVLALCDSNNYCKQSETAKLNLFVTNKTDDSLISGATCYIDIWNPSDTKITDDGVVIEVSEGKYYYTLSGAEISTNGTFTYLFNCTYSAYTSFVSNSYYMSSETPVGLINKIIDYIETSTSILYQSILNYLNGNLVTVINEGDKVEIAQNTWNNTVVNTREVTADPTCKTRPFYNITTHQWGTLC